MTNSIRVSDYIVDFIAKQGVKHIFLVPGGGAMHLNDALAQSTEVQFVPNHHEQASVIAAEAYSRVNGHLGAAMLTTGPGGTNGITPVVGAWIESVPLMIISGQVKRADLIGDSGVRQKGPQEVDIVSIVKPVTKYAVTVMDAGKIRYHMEKALFLATTARRGPVWVDVPLDIQGSMIDPDSLEGFIPDAPVHDDQLDKKIGELLQRISQSKRPLILAGHGIRLSGAAEKFAALVEKLQVPCVTTWNSMDLLPYENPLNVGRPGVVAQRPPNFAVQNCDLLIALGARMDNVVTAFNPTKFGRDAFKVMVDIDINEINKFQKPVDLPIVCDAKVFVEKMLDAAAHGPSHTDRSEWLERCVTWKEKYPPGDGRPVPESGPIGHYDLMGVLSDEIAPDTLIVTGSSGLAVELFYIAFKNKPGQRIFLTSGLGSMGYGVPAALGASLSKGIDVPIVGIESDGSLQMNLQELMTIKSFNIPVRLFILNNEGYASIRTTQRNYFNSRFIGTGPEAKLMLPDIVKIAEAMGIPALRIDDASELREKVRYTLAHPGPIICDVSLISTEILLPKVTAVPQEDGSMISLPLEDMAPLLSRDELRANMLVPLDPASEKISV